jgi:hypothetical protein
LDNASFARCRSSILGFSEISTMALRAASAPPTTSVRAKGLVRLIIPIRRCRPTRSRRVCKRLGANSTRSSQTQHKRSPVSRSQMRRVERDLESVAWLRVNGAEQRGTTSYKGPQERRNWAQESWINVHVALQKVQLWKTPHRGIEAFSKRLLSDVPEYADEAQSGRLPGTNLTLALEFWSSFASPLQVRAELWRSAQPSSSGWNPAEVSLSGTRPHRALEGRQGSEPSRPPARP